MKIIKRKLDVEKLRFGLTYESGEMAIIDWVAGGNFDGYIYKKYLVFYEKDNKVTLELKVINQERSDSSINDNLQEGKFVASDHNTITCIFEGMNMRGKVLGENFEFIAFSIHYPNFNRIISECYHLKEKV